jgi:carnosine synthase
MQALRDAAMPLGGLDGVTTFCEMAVPLVARLAEGLGLPGNTPDAVDAARDKVRT